MCYFSLYLNLLNLKIINYYKHFVIIKFKVKFYIFFLFQKCLNIFLKVKNFQTNFEISKNFQNLNNKIILKITYRENIKKFGLICDFFGIKYLILGLKSQI